NWAVSPSGSGPDFGLVRLAPTSGRSGGSSACWGRSGPAVRIFGVLALSDPAGEARGEFPTGGVIFQRVAPSGVQVMTAGSSGTTTTLPQPLLTRLMVRCSCVWMFQTSIMPSPPLATSVCPSDRTASDPLDESCGNS